MADKRLAYKGKEALRELESLTKKAHEVQKRLLRQILERNKTTEYLNKYMEGSTDKSVFKSRVPVVNYAGIRPYIQRICNGEDSSLISAQPIVEMLTSSGTSEGEPKLMPSIAEDLNRRTYVYNLIMPILNEHLPGLDEGKAMYLYFVKAEKTTPCGLPARPVLTSYYKSKHFKSRTCDAFNDYTSPYQTILCTDIDQSMYCQLLAGLIHRRQVLRLGAVFASAFLRAITFLEQYWPDLCKDIRSGRLGSFVTDAGCQEAISTILKPDPQLSDEIQAICSRKSWKEIVCQLWPRAKYIEVIVTGSMSQYIPSLEFYAGKLPLVSTMYASSECYIGVNLKPLCEPANVAYTLLPNMAYFEFIPLENGVDLDEDEEVAKERLVGLAEVKLGFYYELVVTTFAGLNRYRIGDVLQVTGFHNRAPQFRFICRRNVILSIDNDKTNEEDLHKSVTTAKKLLEAYDALLVEYTSYADTSSIPGHYVLFWEVAYTSAAPGPLVEEMGPLFQRCCLVVENSLDYVYRRCRSYDRSVGPLEIRVVGPGAFEALMDHCVSRGGSINQYKTPRCIKSDSALGLLNSRVTACFFSTTDPLWNP